MLEIGDKVYYAEIKEGERSKRFLLPSESGIIEKLKAFLADCGSLFLIRHGEAQLTNAGVPCNEQLFTGYKFDQDLSFPMAKLYGHPDVQTGLLRYSQAFTNAVLAQEAMVSSIPDESYVQNESQSVVNVQQVTNPVDELRARLEVPKKPEVVPEVPVQPTIQGAIPNSFDLKKKEQDAKKAEENAKVAIRAQLESQGITRATTSGKQATEYLPHSPVEDTPYPTIREVINVVRDIGVKVQHLSDAVDIIGYDVSGLLKHAQVPKGKITGKEFATWFAKMTADIGYDKTFEIIALKLQDLE